MEKTREQMSVVCVWKRKREEDNETKCVCVWERERVMVEGGREKLLTEVL